MMCGATVAYARSIQQLQEDLLIIRPTILVSVPRIYERVYAGIRAKLAEGPALNRKLFALAVEIGSSRFEYQQGRGSWRHISLVVAATGNAGGDESNDQTGRAASRCDEWWSGVAGRSFARVHRPWAAHPAGLRHDRKQPR